MIMSHLVTSVTSVHTEDESTTKPALRTGHTATRLRDELLVFGGSVDGTCTASVLALHLGSYAWQPIAPTGATPSARLGHATCAVDEGGGGDDGGSAPRLWVFGGGDGRVLLSDLWTLERDGVASCTWKEQTCAGEPAARMGHSLAFLPSLGALVSFGGFVKGVKGGYSAQLLLLDLTTLTWTHPRLLPPAPEVPLRGRLGAATASLPGGDTILFLGGSAAGELLDEVLVLRVAPSVEARRRVAGGERPLDVLDEPGLSLERLPDAVGLRSAPSALPRPRAHGVALSLPPYVLHVGGCAVRVRRSMPLGSRLYPVPCAMCPASVAPRLPVPSAHPEASGSRACTLYPAR